MAGSASWLGPKIFILVRRVRVSYLLLIISRKSETDLHACLISRKQPVRLWLPQHQDWESYRKQTAINLIIYKHFKFTSNDNVSEKRIYLLV